MDAPNESAIIIKNTYIIWHFNCGILFKIFTVQLRKVLSQEEEWLSLEKGSYSMFAFLPQATEAWRQSQRSLAVVPEEEGLCVFLPPVYRFLFPISVLTAFAICVLWF